MLEALLLGAILSARWGLTGMKERGGITSLTLLVTLLSMQPRVWLDFWTSGACAHVKFFIHSSLSIHFSQSVLMFGIALTQVQILALEGI